MSFILDALRRAETQRANQPQAPVADRGLGDVAEKTASLPSPRWIAIILTGVAAIAIVSVYVLNRPDPATPRSAQIDGNSLTTPRQPAPVAAVGPNTPLADTVAMATREIRPLGKEARSTTPAQSETSARSEDNAARVTPGTVSVSQEPLSATDIPSRSLTNLPAGQTETRSSLPSYQDVVLSGRGQMPEFHLDIHVYSAAPERRFVFVNNRKYREGQKLDEGGTVERITPVGVVLNHRGRRFELVPD